MSTRPRAEIMRDLKALLAELDYVMHGHEEEPPDISPKLEQALAATRQASTSPHEDIKAKARAYDDRPIVPRHDDIRPDDPSTGSGPRPEKKERLRDYKQVDDPDWPPDSTWMGTGDQKLIE